ncbi:MAG: DUF1571 domain-containing protein [Phycisphaerae bacterium]
MRPATPIAATAGPVELTDDERSKQIEADPLAYLHHSLETTRRLKSFTTTFLRQERLGLFKQLHPAETIFAEYRDEPFSVRFTWQDPNSEYYQCVYVEGRDDNKVLLLTRHGPFGLPPSVGRWDPQLGVTFAKTRNPITDFGPRRMLERTLDRIEKARPHGPVEIRLIGLTEIGRSRERCFHLEIRYPKGDRYACKLHDLFINAKTGIPVASRLWLPGKADRSDETLDAQYIYSDIHAKAAMTDANFAIDPKGLSAAHAADRTPTPGPTPGGSAPGIAISGQTADH